MRICVVLSFSWLALASAFAHSTILLRLLRKHGSDGRRGRCVVVSSLCVVFSREQKMTPKQRNDRFVSPGFFFPY